MGVSPQVQVAMKVIDKRKAAQDPYMAKNFRREAKLLKMVKHPNIIQLFEVIETPNSYYLITELCSGEYDINFCNIPVVHIHTIILIVVEFGGVLMWQFGNLALNRHYYFHDFNL